MSENKESKCACGNCSCGESEGLKIEKATVTELDGVSQFVLGAQGLLGALDNLVVQQYPFHAYPKEKLNGKESKCSV